MATDVQIVNKLIETDGIRYLTINGDSIDTVNFHFPRIYNGKDLFAGTCHVLYKRPDGTGDAEILTMTATSTEITASWDIRPNFTSLTGKAYISVRVILEANTWQSFTAPVIVERSIYPTDMQYEPTILDQYLHLFEVIKNETVQAKEDAEAAAATAVGVITDPSFIIVSDDLALGELSNIKIVATNIDNVNLVGGSIDNVNEVADGMEDIVAVMTHLPEINAVAAITDEVVNVSGISEKIVAVDANKINIDKVADNEININAVNANAENINAVAGNAENIDAVADNADNINAVNANAVNINKVAAIDTSVSAVADIDAQITALSLIIDNIVSVDGFKTEIVEVSGSLVEIAAVYAKLTEITALYGIIPEIEALYAHLDTIALKANQSDLENLAGAGRTTETVKKNADDIATLNGSEDTEGSVLKSIKDNAEDADFTPVGGIEAVTIAGAIEELDAEKEPADSTILKEADIINDLSTGGVSKPLSAEQGKVLNTDKADKTSLAQTDLVVSNLRADYDTNKKQTDQRITNISAEVQKVDEIYNLGSPSVLGTGTASDWATPVVVEAKDGDMEAVLEGKLGTQGFVGGKGDSIANWLQSSQGLLSTDGEFITFQTNSTAFARYPYNFKAGHVYYFSTLGQCIVEGTRTLAFRTYSDATVKDIFQSIVPANTTLQRFSSVITATEDANFLGIRGSGDSVESTYRVKFIVLYNLTALGLADKLNTTAKAQAYFQHYHAGTLGVGEMRVRVTDGTRDSIAYTPPIGFRVGNVADSFNVVTGVHTKRVSSPVAIASGTAVNTTNYPLAKNTGSFYIALTAGGGQSGIIGTDSSSGAGMLYYELATTVLTSYDTQHLQAFAGGTMYIEPAKRDGMVYNNGLTFDKNVLSVDTLYKFVAGEKIAITSFTITNNVVTSAQLSNGDVCRAEVTFKSDQSLVPVSKTKVPYFNLYTLLQILAGGTTGQALTKQSNDPYDFAWV